MSFKRCLLGSSSSLGQNRNCDFSFSLCKRKKIGPAEKKSRLVRVGVQREKCGLKIILQQVNPTAKVSQSTALRSRVLWPMQKGLMTLLLVAAAAGVIGLQETAGSSQVCFVTHT